MKYSLLICLLLAILFTGCKKEKGDFVTGTVVSKGGCWNTSYLVTIDNPDFTDHKFLRPTVLACFACPNVSNSVYIKLTPDLSSPGTRIRFVFVETIPSCLSSSEAPNHIEVKNLARR
jgi:hypothetical protein